MLAQFYVYYPARGSSLQASDDLRAGSTAGCSLRVITAGK